MLPVVSETWRQNTVKRLSFSHFVRDQVMTVPKARINSGAKIPRLDVDTHSMTK